MMYKRNDGFVESEPMRIPSKGRNASGLPKATTKERETWVDRLIGAIVAMCSVGAALSVVFFDYSATNLFSGLNLALLSGVGLQSAVIALLSVRVLSGIRRIDTSAASIAHAVARAEVVLGGMRQELQDPRVGAKEQGPPEPKPVSDGIVDGRWYKLFADGSVHLETMLGFRKFASISEAQQFVGSSLQIPCREARESSIGEPTSSGQSRELVHGRFF